MKWKKKTRNYRAATQGLAVKHFLSWECLLSGCRSAPQPQLGFGASHHTVHQATSRINTYEDVQVHPISSLPTQVDGNAVFSFHFSLFVFSLWFLLACCDAVFCVWQACTLCAAMWLPTLHKQPHLCPSPWMRNLEISTGAAPLRVAASKIRHAPAGTRDAQPHFCLLFFLSPSWVHSSGQH